MDQLGVGEVGWGLARVGHRERGLLEVGSLQDRVACVWRPIVGTAPGLGARLREVGGLALGVAAGRVGESLGKGGEAALLTEGLVSPASAHLGVDGALLHAELSSQVNEGSPGEGSCLAAQLVQAREVSWPVYGSGAALSERWG